jgi:hypothetical protein
VTDLTVGEGSVAGAPAPGDRPPVRYIAFTVACVLATLFIIALTLTLPSG